MLLSGMLMFLVLFMRSVGSCAYDFKIVSHVVVGIYLRIQICPLCGSLWS